MARRPVPELTAGYLQAVTTRYLSLRSTSSAHLRRLLLERARRSPTPAPAARELVEVEITRLLEGGWLDDQRYADALVRTLHARGGSAARIRGALVAKGVAEEVSTGALAALGDEAGDPEWLAALTWARKRRLGPWRSTPGSAEDRGRELARMGRAGFPYGLARRVLELTEIP